MATLTVNHLSYQYPLTNKKSLKDLSYTFQQGKVYGIVGENEAGKTTFCHALRGFIPSFFQGDMTGEVQIDGVNILDFNLGELSKSIGYVFQNPFTQISGVKDTVYEELAYGMENLGFSKEEMINRVEELLSLFHLEELKSQNPFELSGGQKQRVAIASILAVNPEIIILDEPTSQLDPKSTEDIFQMIALLKNEGKTVILVEHKVDFMSGLCDEILVMKDGALSISGPTKDIFSNPELSSYGGQLPQLSTFFLNYFSELKEVPMTLSDAVSVMKKGGF